MDLIQTAALVIIALVLADISDSVRKMAGR